MTELLHHQEVTPAREGDHIHPIGALEAVERVLAPRVGAPALGDDLAEEARILAHALGLLDPGGGGIKALGVAVEETHQ